MTIKQTHHESSLGDLEARIAAVFNSGKIISDDVAKLSWTDYGIVAENEFMIPIPFAPTVTGIESDTLKDMTPLATTIYPDSPVGMKFDNGKLDWALLPFESVEEIIKVLMVGAKKYKRDNWQLVEDGDTRYFNAAMRHLTAWKQGEELDPETDLPHLAHAGCCLLFLISKNRIGYNVKE